MDFYLYSGSVNVEKVSEEETMSLHIAIIIVQLKLPSVNFLTKNLKMILTKFDFYG